ncbi:hypothetical protein CPL00345_CDS0152 [Klebsiella phage GlastoCabaret]
MTSHTIQSAMPSTATSREIGGSITKIKDTIKETKETWE